MIIDHSNMTSSDMVTEKCPVMPEAVDILCIRCGWEGHAGVPHAPWPVFMVHARTAQSFFTTLMVTPTGGELRSTTKTSSSG